jgi:hypothetical protein
MVDQQLKALLQEFERQTDDQRLHLGSGVWPANLVLPPEGPLSRDQLAVPFEHRIGLDQQQALLQPLTKTVPARFETRSQHRQDQLFTAREARCVLDSALQEPELVTQHQDFQVLFTLSLPSNREQIEQERNEKGKERAKHTNPGSETKITISLPRFSAGRAFCASSRHGWHFRAIRV